MARTSPTPHATDFSLAGARGALQTIAQRCELVQPARLKAFDIVAVGSSRRGAGRRHRSVPFWDKKRAAVTGGSSHNREASNRVDRSHSMSRRWTVIVMVEK